MSAITRSKPTAVTRKAKKSEAKVSESTTPEMIKPAAKAKQADFAQPDKAANRREENSSKESPREGPEESQENTALHVERNAQHHETQTTDAKEGTADKEDNAEHTTTTPAMVQPAELWRKNCSKPHRI